MRIIVCLLLLSISDGFCRQKFHHRARGRDYGYLRDWELDSRGSVSKIVNLDELADVRVAKNNKGEVIINLRDVTETSGWQPGWFLISSHVRQRDRSGVKHVSIVRKISHVHVVSSSKVLVKGEDVSPLELIREARVLLKYPGAGHHPAHHRHKRFVSDLLSTALDKINFRADNSDDVIRFNRDTSGRTLNEYNIYKQRGQEVKVSKVITGQQANLPSETDFLLKCKDCYEERTVDQTLQLDIERKKKEANLKQFSLQTEMNTSLQVDFELEIKSAVGIQEKLLLDSSSPTTLRTLPLAVVDEKLPPIQLVVTYNRNVYLEINATSDGPMKYNGKYSVNGSYVSSSHERQGETPVTDVTTSGWSVGDSSFSGHSEKPYNISFRLYQEVTLQASIKWAHHDVALLFTPPEVSSFLPLLYARTTENPFKRCEEATLTVTGVFKYDKAEFVAKAFHKTVWDIFLRNETLVSTNLAEVKVSQRCGANCFSHVEHSSDSMESICGTENTKIVRGDKEFEKLTYIGGDFVLFLSEEADQASWCGTKGRACHRCTWSDNDDSKNDACADRLMTSSAAESLTTLGRLVFEEWPKRKLVVLESWDEPTSKDVTGSHGVTSLHYSGRALQVGLSAENPSNSSSLTIDTEKSSLNRLAQLASCSGFPFADVTSGYVQMCVRSDQVEHRRMRRSFGNEESDEFAKEELMKTLANIGTSSVPITCKSHHGAVMSAQTRDKVINPILQEHDYQKGLVQYMFNDVDFKPEGLSYPTCYQPTRKCKSTCEVSHSREPWDWCQTRAITPRMAIRLRRLALIVKNKTKGGRVSVTKPIFNGHRGTVKGIIRNKDYELHGRKLRLSPSIPHSLSATQLYEFASCAGFDFMEVAEPGSIDVYVKLQNGFQTTVVPFQHSTLLPVKVKDPDFEYPVDLKNESRKTFLFDGFNNDIQLSQHFKISHFKHVEKRFFRLDPALVDCLETVATDLEDGFNIVPNSVYRSHSINMRDEDKRHPEERLRFETGQAVYLQARSKHSDALVDLAQYTLRLCTPTLRLQSRGLGIGCHSDKIYIDIRPMTSGDVTDIADVWNVDNEPLFDSITKALSELKMGGPAIFPLNLKRTCKDPRLGHDFAYYSFNSKGIGFCFHDRESRFCKDTRDERKHETDKLRDQFIKVAGTTLTRGHLEKNLHACVFDNCGGCPGKGPTWHKKVEGCVHLVHLYLEKARNPFQHVVDQAAFFNTENPDSSVHSLACHDGAKCVEDTQIYSLVMPLLNSKYKPDPTLSQEELLYSGHDNPSPIPSLLEQEFAKQVAGTVRVYIEDESDMAILRDVIKVLMIYNRNVTEVEFHITEEVDADNVISSLQRKLEYWAGSTCPKWSRFAVAPYSVHPIPHHRKRRSLERSKNRNDVKRSIRDWEIDWIKRM